MIKLTDELLMAYVDAELSEAERNEVEIALANDAKARDEVERYRKTRSAIDQLANILNEPIPDGLSQTVHNDNQQFNVIESQNKAKQATSWLAIAASLVIGMTVGAGSMNYFSADTAQDTNAIASYKIAELSKALEASNIEQSKLQEQVIVAEKEAQKKPVENGINNIFPFKLVSKAIDNGAKLSLDMQKNIVAELNKTAPPATEVSSFSKLIKRSKDNSLISNASQYETLGDLQLTEPERDYLVSNKIKSVVGEFTYLGKKCRLFEYQQQPKTEVSLLIACRDGSGEWRFVHGQ